MNPALALIIANTIWGAALPIFKFSLQNIPPFTLGCVRFLFASCLLLPFVIKRWQPVNLKDIFKIFLTSFFGLFAAIFFLFLGLQRGESINASIITSSGPLLLFLISVLILKEKPHYKVFIGMILSMIGVLVIILSPIFLDGKKFLASEISANIFFLLATLGSIIAPLIAKSVLNKINAIQFTFISFVFTSAAFLPFSLRELTTWSFSELNIQGWTGIIFGIFLSSGLAYLLFFWGTSKISSQEIGVFAYVDPVAALIIAVPLLGERPTIYFFAGAILVFLGIFIAEGRLHWHPLHRLKQES